MADSQCFDVFSPTCPSRLVMNRIGDRWTLFVILSLTDGPMRFTRLKARIGQITSKVLTETLRSLERDGLVAREIFAEMPPRVEYSLTELGDSLIGPISAVREWAELHVGEILVAREGSEVASSPA